MADVRRQGEYCAINVNPFAVPGDQTMTDKGVTQIVKARRGVMAARFPTEDPVAEILDIGREYRDRAEAGQLYRITPQPVPR